MFVSEERRIAQRIKDFIKSKERLLGTYVMLRNGRILGIENYSDMVKAGKVNPKDAYVYIVIYGARFRSTFYYPLLVWYHDFLSEFLNAFLSKLGFHCENYVVPAAGLKYVAAAVIDFYTRKYLSIEVSNLDTVVNNTNLRMITFEVLDGKLVSGENELTDEEYDKILDMFMHQRLFAGYTPGEAKDIIKDYYDEGNQSLVKEVARIAMDYDRIFNPYRVCYETETWDEVDCLSIKL